ncbi:MAG: type II CRISPR RNA-guided endonuclease Cas9, partial [Oscillibacter sp.]|nr:type II CRISPR RNA-guided endonuclease Cas9 [Oscillibacter sp.]
MIPYAIGLDIGITSVGWAVVALDAEDCPYGIIDMGARIFDAAEQPKTGASLAAPRREARIARRRLRRRNHRKERIRALLVSHGLLSQTELDSLFQGRLESIYALRVRALDEAVTAREFARILIHLSQRRGFRSNRKGAASKEDGELLSAVAANKSSMEEHRYRTAAEMFLCDERYKNHQRNKGGNYLGTISRDMVETEVREIFAAQRRFNCPFADSDLEEVYLAILLGQRSFDAGPARGPYSGDQIERMWGRCTFEPEEPRAARAAYSFEYFRLLEDVNHIRLMKDGNAVPLTAAQRQMLIALAHKSDNLNYARIRKELQIPVGQLFNMVSYDRTGKTSGEDAEKKKKFSHLSAYHQMRKAFDKVSKGYFSTFTMEQRNTLGQVLSMYKTPKNIQDRLRNAGFSDRDIEIAETLGFSKTGHLSVKACDKIIPYLEQGMKYSDACETAGYHFKAHNDGEKCVLLPALRDEEKESITSPVVLRAVAQTRKVLNAIIREQGGSPVYINIELAREMAKDFAERSQDQRNMEDNQAKNERLMERIRKEYKKQAPSGTDLVKLKLYEQQGGVCPYSVRQMSAQRLLEPGYAEIDHIIPYSISFDDSYKNKVLVFAEENRNKGNRLPLEYLEGERRERFIVWVNSSVRDFRKRQRLLKEHLTPEDEEGFKERNLQDTKTASRFLLNYIRDHLEFAPFSSGKEDSEMKQGRKHVTAVNGQMTAELRKHWGLRKVRANGDLHHAVDALVIACTTDSMIQKASAYWKYRERRYRHSGLAAQEQAADWSAHYQRLEEGGQLVNPDTGEVLKEFPFPWPQFRLELEARLGSNPQRAVLDQRFPVYLSGEVTARPLFVSRAPRRKVTGPAHKETVKSTKALED